MHLSIAYPRMGGGRGCNPRELDSVERPWVGNLPQGGKFDSAAILESEGRQNETCFLSFWSFMTKSILSLRAQAILAQSLILKICFLPPDAALPQVFDKTKDQKIVRR